MENIFWVVSKVIWSLLAPEVLLLFLLILGTCLLWTRHSKRGHNIITFSVVIIALITILPFSDLILSPLENRFPVPKKLPNKVSGIIVLAGAEEISVTSDRNQPSLNSGGERLTTFIWLANNYPDAMLVFSGGSGSLFNQKQKSVDTARMIFEQVGLDSKRVKFESESKNTAESANYTFQLIKPNIDQKWILVTSAYHIPRSVGLFRRAGWNVIPYPVDFITTKSLVFKFDLKEIGKFSRGLREWLGILVYRIIGKTSELFPRPYS